MGHCMSKKVDEPTEDPVSARLTGWTHLAWSGGAAKGILYVGAYRELYEAGVIGDVQGAVGSSVGSVFAAATCMGLAPIHIHKWIMDMDTGKLFDNSWCTLDDIVKFATNKGLYRGRYLERKCEEFLFTHTGIHNITFSELQRRTSRHLKICVTNITQGRAEYWDHVTQPGMLISRAIRVSASMPVIYDPVEVGTDLYCDAGITDNMALDAFENMTTLGLLLLGKYEQDNAQVLNLPTGNLIEYAVALYTCTAALTFGLQHPGRAWQDRTIVLRGPTNAQWDAEMTVGEKRRWIAIGAQQASKKMRELGLARPMSTLALPKL